MPRRRERLGGLTRRPLCTALVAALVAALVVPPVQAELCTKRKGQVVFRKKACKRKEAAFSVAAVVTPGEKGDTGAPGTGQPRLRAVDANGQPLPGILNEYGELVFQVGGAVFSVAILTNGFRPGTVLFDAPNCTGPFFVSALEGDLYLRAAVRGARAYYPDGPVAPHDVKSRLFASSPQDCTGTGKTYDAATGDCCQSVTSSAMAAPPSFVDLSGFVPPFRVEVEE